MAKTTTNTNKRKDPQKKHHPGRVPKKMYVLHKIALFDLFNCYKYSTNLSCEMFFFLKKNPQNFDLSKSNVFLKRSNVMYFCKIFLVTYILSYKKGGYIFNTSIDRESPLMPKKPSDQVSMTRKCHIIIYPWVKV